MILPWDMDRADTEALRLDEDLVARAAQPFTRAATDVSRGLTRASLAANPTTGAAGAREAMIAAAPELARLGAAGANATLDARRTANENAVARSAARAENNAGLFGSLLNAGSAMGATLLGGLGGAPGGAPGGAGGLGGLLGGAAPMAGTAIGTGMGGPLGGMLGGALGNAAGGMLGGGNPPTLGAAMDYNPAAAGRMPGAAGGYGTAPAPGSLDTGPRDPMDAWSSARPDGIPIAPRGGFALPPATGVRPGGLMGGERGVHRGPVSAVPGLPGLPLASGGAGMTEEEMMRLGLLGGF